MTNPKTLARTENPQTSKDAAKRMVESGKLNQQELMVYDTILSYVRCHPLDENFTTKDIAKWRPWFTYDKFYEICRRRFSGLFDKFKIVLTGERRDNCRVWRLL